MKVALYARVSTAAKLERQDPETQLYALRDFCARRGWDIAHEYIEHLSAVGKRRPRYEEMLTDAYRRHFDTILVVRLDRIFRSVGDFVRTVERLNRFGVRFVCVDQPIDTDRQDPAGQLLMTIIAAVAEFERSLISERVKAGIARARAQGKPWGGRPAKVVDIARARQLRGQGYTLREIGAALHINRNLLGKTLKADPEVAQ